jgi:peptidoglycan hydrolase-like protein with peptidoglycan-binding domain
MRMKLAIAAVGVFVALPAMAQPYYYRPYPYYAPAYPPPAYVPPPYYPPPAAYAPAMSHRELVTEIQDELEEHGYRPGPYDGVLDPQTRSAIRSYERASGLPVTGEATPELLEHLRYRAPAAQAPATSPPPAYGQPSYNPPPSGQTFDSNQRPYPEGQQYPQGQGTSYTQPAVVPPTYRPPANPPPAYQPPDAPPPTYTSRPEQLAPAPTPEYTARPPLARAGDPDVAWVQDALRRKGYAPGPADGLMGDRTRRAIEAFQRDQGMPVDGNIGPGLIAKLR